ncbi:MAG: DUF3365 domain-containing protein [Chromatiales bacterium]|jgi:hypothetical protein
MAQQPDEQQARALAMQLGKSLKTTLQSAMKNGGPVAAIEACNTSAPVIAEQISGESGWSVGRTSLKLRNRNNAPDAWEMAVLQQFEQRKAAGESPKTLEYSEVIEKDGVPSFRFMKAIPTAEVCLNCHGGAVKDEVAAKLDQLYPGDQARGFQLGDLRGAFTLSKPL